MNTKMEKFESTLPAGPQRYLAVGAYHAALISEIIDGGLPAAMQAQALMGGVDRPTKRLGSSLVAACRRAGRVPAYRIVDYPRRDWRTGEDVVDRRVWCPRLTWRFSRGSRQVGHVEWVPSGYIHCHDQAETLSGWSAGIAGASSADISLHLPPI